MSRKPRRMDLSGCTDYFCPHCRNGWLVMEHVKFIGESNFIVSCTHCDWKYKKTFGSVFSISPGHDLENAMSVIKDVFWLTEHQKEGEDE